MRHRSAIQNNSVQRGPTGVTLIELMVVLSVIGLLISLTIPAIASARESARRINCLSNLRQLGIAVHAYHDNFGMCPSGLLPSNEYFGWPTRILPYLDQPAIYQSLPYELGSSAFTKYYRSTQSIIPAGATPLSIFRCPSSVLPVHARWLGPRSQMDPAFVGYAISDYKGSAGPSLGFGMFTILTWEKVHFHDVTDGLSQTLLIGEASLPNKHGTEMPLWIAYYGDAGRNSLIDTLKPINCVKSFGGSYWDTATEIDCALSMHPQQCLFVFGDGAARPLSENIDRDVYHLLGSISDGKTIDHQF